MQFALRALAATVLSTTAASKVALSLSPVTRVVELLNELYTTLENDAAAEEKLMLQFRCWAESTIEEKTASNEAAKERVAELTQYMADIDAGAVEFSSERVELEKELAETLHALEEAASTREREHGEFVAAEDELQKAVAALQAAASTLADATVDATEGVFLVSRDLQSVSTLLDADVQVSLREAPKDWEKLNKKADFKMRYKGRSFKLQAVIADLLKQFQEQLRDAVDAEAAAVATHGQVMGAKQGDANSTRAALREMAKESGASGMSRADAVTEQDALNVQITADTGFIGSASSQLTAKKREYKIRKGLRAQELAGVRQAISILHADDARDLFKRSLTSQGYSFAQLKKGTAAAAVAASLGLKVDPDSPFSEVIAAVDARVRSLDLAEEQDRAQKEHCETTRFENTTLAKKLSQEVDDHSATISRAVALVEELERKIAELREQIDALVKELATARANRTAETEQFRKSDSDDGQAVTILTQAQTALGKFYTENGLNLTQQTAPGAMPVPPPTTWDSSGYGGRNNENEGIVSVLQMIIDDVSKDRAAAAQAEQSAEAAFIIMRDENVIMQGAKQTEADGHQIAIGLAEDEIGSEGGLRTGARGTLKETLGVLESLRPGCDFIQLNFEARKHNRVVERDGLHRARAVLKGANFK